MQSDRRDITSLHGAANGQASSPTEGRKKRRREDERLDRSGRPRPFGSSGSSLFSGLAQDNLHSTSHSMPTGSGSTVFAGMSSAPSRSQAHRATMAHSAFSVRPNDSKDRLTETNNATQSFTLIEDEGEPNDRLSGRTTDQHLSRPSDDIDKRMSGSNEEGIPMSAWFNGTPSSGLPRQAMVESPVLRSTNRERSSSVDPINLISEKTPHVSRRSTRSERRPAQVEHITIEDDEDEKTIENMLQPPTRRPGTPTGQTTFREGHVKETTAKHDSMTQQSLNPFLQPRSSGITSPAKRTSLSTSKPGPSSKSSSTPIVPGFTRSGIAKNMRPKSGLKIDRTGAEAKAQLPAAILNHKDPGHPPTSKSTVVNQFGELTFNIQEWYCGSKRYGDGKSTWPNHRFHCGPGSMVSLRTLQSGSPLVLLQNDIERFEIAESVHKNPDVEEFVPALRFAVTNACATSSAWARASDGDDYPYALIIFDLRDGSDENKWRQMVDCVGKFAKKNIVNAQAMNNLIKQARNQPRKDKYRYRPKPGELAQEDSKQLLPVVPPTISGPSTRTRTKAATAQPKGERFSTEFMELPAEDLDEIMLVYPSTGPGAVNINRAELLRLDDGEFLNDTLIELGLKLWLNELREKNPELFDQVHVFNSFFFKKLDSGRGKVCDYNSVKKWTSKIDLFKKRFVIVPINEHLHWYLAIIFLPEHALHAPPPQPIPRPTRKTRSSNTGPTESDGFRASQESDIPTTERNSVVELDVGSPLEPGQMEIDADLANRSQQSMVINDTEMDDLTTRANVKAIERPPTPVLDLEDEEVGVEDQNSINAKKCWILVFDSLKGKHARTIRILREYLQAEAQERHGKLIETKDAKLSGGFIEDKHLPVPEQPNWCDCGVYLLHYVEAFVANPLELLVTPGLRRKSSPEEAARYNDLWRTTDVVEKRRTFRSQIKQLSEAWRQSKSQLTQVPKNLHSISGELAPDVQLDPPLPNITGELSVVEVAPPDAPISSNEPAAPTESEGPTRTGELPPMPADNQVSLQQPLSFLPLEQGEDVSVTEISSVGDEARHSEEPSSVSGHRVRRGKKGGERHSGSGWHLKSTQSSPASQVPEASQVCQPADVSGVPESPEL